MKHLILTYVFALAAASGALAQDGLTPTDVLDGGKVAVTGRLQFASGQGNFVLGSGVDADVDIQQFQVNLAGAVGLGMGFEVEVGIPYQFMSDSEIDGSGAADLKFEEIGFGDLVISPVYRILKDGADGPQLVVAAIAVIPTGKTEPAEPEIAGVGGEEGGIGDAVYKFGFMAGVSKRLGIAEPYLTVTWLSGGDGEIQSDSIDVERAEHLFISFGSEFHLGPQVSLDVRGTLDFAGDETQTDKGSGVEEVEEAHFTHSWQAELRFTAGSGVTLLIGLGVAFIEDHKIDEASNISLEDTFIYAATIGIHINLGL